MNRKRDTLLESFSRLETLVSQNANDVNRRAFLIRAGQLSVAASLGAPTLETILRNPERARRDGILREVPTEYAQQPDRKSVV